MGALARFLGGPGVVSPLATDSAGSVYVYAHTQESRSSALAGAWETSVVSLVLMLR